LWYCIDESSLPIKQLPNPPHHLIDTLNNKHSHVMTMEEAYFCVDNFFALFEPMANLPSENTDIEILQKYRSHGLSMVLKEQKSSTYSQSLHAAFAQCCIDKLLSDPQ
jgi:hypothetical protein